MNGRRGVIIFRRHLRLTLPPSSATVPYYRSVQRLRLCLFIVALLLVERALCQRDKKSANDNDPSSAGNSPTYEWEDWNFYQILGLEDVFSADGTSASGNTTEDVSDGRGRQLLLVKQQQREQIGMVQVKKAYRKQAQRHHPDKILHRKKQRQDQERNKTQDQQQQKKRDEGKKPPWQIFRWKRPRRNATSSTAGSASPPPGTESSEKTLKEEEQEANARFARIAEAYQVLIDESEKKRYDLHLAQDEMEMEEMKRWQKQKEHEQKHWHRYHEEYDDEGEDSDDDEDEGKKKGFFFTDPRKLFEQFFSSSGESTEDGEKDWDSYDDNAKFRYDGGYDGMDRGPPQKIEERRQVLYDARMGEIHRVFHRESWPQDDDAYFRVVSQDFILEGAYEQLRLVPISDRVIVEEGYDRPQQNRRRQRQEIQRQHRERGGGLQELSPGEYMTPDSPPLWSRNGQYAAFLTRDCELIVLELSDDDDDDEYNDDSLYGEKIWTSDTFYPMDRSGMSCILRLSGPRAVLLVGEHPDRARGVLWTSPLTAKAEVMMMMMPYGGTGYEFRLSLDDDGSLVVYRHQHPNLYHGMGGVGGWSMRKKKRKNPIVQLWRRLCSTLHQQTSYDYENSEDDDSDDEDEEDDTEEEEHVTECVWASGMAGCQTEGRRIVAVGRTLKRTCSRLGLVVKRFYENLSKPDPYDDEKDILDVVLQVLGRAGMEIVQAGRNGLQAGVAFVKSATAKFSEAVACQWDKVRHEM